MRTWSITVSRPAGAQGIQNARDLRAQQLRRAGVLDDEVGHLRLLVPPGAGRRSGHALSGSAMPSRSASLRTCSSTGVVTTNQPVEANGAARFSTISAAS